MNKEKLKKVQLEILNEIKRICNENDIKFFLDYGTLIGAVRHKGMIPWDDDIDLGMLRDDYEKFCSIAPTKLAENFYLQSWDNDKDYALPFSKVRKNNTHFIEKSSAETGQNNGIFVDIFPYDNYPNGKLTRFFQKYCIYILNKMLLAKCGYVVWKLGNSGQIKRIVYRILNVISKCFSKRQLCLWYKKVETLGNDRKTDHYLGQAGDGQYDRWKVPAEYLEGITYLEFEGELYPCPQKYDLYLRCFYGDYMKLPPVEERVAMHDVIKIIIDGEEI